MKPLKRVGNFNAALHSLTTNRYHF